MTLFPLLFELGPYNFYFTLNPADCVEMQQSAVSGVAGTGRRTCALQASLRWTTFILAPLLVPGHQSTWGRIFPTREGPLYRRLFHRSPPANPRRQRVPSSAPGLRTPSGQLVPRPPPSLNSLSPELSPCSDLRHSLCKLL